MVDQRRATSLERGTTTLWGRMSTAWFLVVVMGDRLARFAGELVDLAAVDALVGGGPCARLLPYVACKRVAPDGLHPGLGEPRGLPMVLRGMWFPAHRWARQRRGPSAHLLPLGFATPCVTALRRGRVVTVPSSGGRSRQPTLLSDAYPGQRLRRKGGIGLALEGSLTC